MSSCPQLEVLLIVLILPVSFSRSVVDCGNALMVLHSVLFFSTTLVQKGALHVNTFPFKFAIYEEAPRAES